MALFLVASGTSSSENQSAATLQTPRFVYPRASPLVRWPRRMPTGNENAGSNADERDPEAECPPQEPITVVLRYNRWGKYSEKEPPPVLKAMEPVKRGSKLSKVQLKRARDWKQRVQRLADAICGLKEHEFVRDTIDGWEEQLTRTDLSYVLQRVGRTSWQRALELYECLNVRRWYEPNQRMLVVMLAMLGRANQQQLAQELFDRAELSVGNTSQVYNSLMGVYARQGDWKHVQRVLCKMQDKGCPPDLVTFNIVIKARTRGGMQDGLAAALLQDIYSAGLTPDTFTYNTLISACNLNNRLSDAMLIFQEMQRQGLRPDIWTYNSMISVYGRAGRVESAAFVFNRMQELGVKPDAVTYNSILHAFARDGKVDEVERVWKMMCERRFSPDGMTYNTMIMAYGRAGLHGRAEELYARMKGSGHRPDAVTYTVLIDSLGKAGLVEKASGMFQDMVESGVKPSLQAFSAMIYAFSKSGMFGEAEKIYGCMLRAGVQPDLLVSSLMLDVFFKAGAVEKCIVLYRIMRNAGMRPELSVYSVMVRVFCGKGEFQEIEKLAKDMQRSSVSLAALASLLARTGGCYEGAAEVLKLAMKEKLPVKLETLSKVLGEFESSGKLSDARELVHSMRSLEPNAAGELYCRLARMCVKAGMFPEAEEELGRALSYGKVQVTDVFGGLVVGYQKARLDDQALRCFLEMLLLGLEVDAEVLQSAVLLFSERLVPGVAEELLDECVLSFREFVRDPTMHISIIESYGKLRQWRSAQGVFRDMQRLGLAGTIESYTALLFVYAESGVHELATRALDEMVSAGVNPSTACVNYVFQALGKAGKARRICELYQQLPQMGITPNMSTFLEIFHAFTFHGQLLEGRDIYRDMRGAGFFPTLPVFKAILTLFTREGATADAEELVKEIHKAGFELDIGVYNMMIGLYCRQGNYWKAADVFKGMQEAGCSPDTATYNNLIKLYSCRDRLQEAHGLLKEMTRAGFEPDVAAYTTLVSGYGRLQAYEEAELVFREMLESGCRPDETAYNSMMNVYRKAGRHRDAEEMIKRMRDDGFEPTVTTIHMLLDSYGKGGVVAKAEEMLEQLPGLGMSPDALHYTSIIESHLQNRDYHSAMAMLGKMRAAGVHPTHVTLSCLLRGASLCVKTSDALMLLSGLDHSGVSLPLRLMTSCTPRVVEEMQNLFSELLETAGAQACQAVVNALLDLLWAFGQCATASLVFAVAIELHVYTRLLARVKRKDWGADFRSLSPGGALVALTLWLDQMQDASLQGSPKPPKWILLNVGKTKMTPSVSKTIKAHLWKMGSPFRPRPTVNEEGILRAKEHSLRMWLKEAQPCMDLELRNSAGLPETSAIRVYNGAFVPAGLVSAIEEIDNSMGEIRSKKFYRLLHLTPKERTNAMEADLRGRADKMAKDLKVKLKMKFSRPDEPQKLRRKWSYRELPPGGEEADKQRRFAISRRKQLLKYGHYFASM